MMTLTTRLEISKRDIAKNMSNTAQCPQLFLNAA